jgi:hypothetical protein
VYPSVDFYPFAVDFFFRCPWKNLPEWLSNHPKVFHFCTICWGSIFTQNGDSTNETSVCDQPGFAIKNWKPTKIWAAEKDLDPWIDQDGIFESAVEGYRKVSRFCFTRVES